MKKLKIQNRPIYSKKIETLIKKISGQKYPCLTGDFFFYLMLKKNQFHCFETLPKKSKTWKHLHFYYMRPTLPDDTKTK
jgi:hypothetical protein